MKYQRSHSFKQLKLRNVIYSNKNSFIELGKIMRYQYEFEIRFEVYFWAIMPLLPFCFFV